jgi:hypothetical protein
MCWKLVICMALAGSALQCATRAASTTAAAPRASGHAAGASFTTTRFDWPVPGTVRVEQHRSKDQRKASFRYELHVCPHASDSLSVNMTGMQVIFIEGLDKADPRYPKMAAMLAKLISDLPTLLVSKDGRAVDVLGIERVLENLKATRVAMEKAERGEPDPSAAEPVPDAQLIQRLKNRASDPWRTWVEQWTRWPALASARASTRERLLGFGAQPMVEARRKQQGSDLRAAQLELTYVVDPLPLDELQGRFQVVELLEEEEKLALKPRLTVTREADIDLQTLRPRRALERRVQEVFIDGERVRDEQSDEYLFDFNAPPPPCTSSARSGSGWR